jgi:hypothetical protein
MSTNGRPKTPKSPRVTWTGGDFVGRRPLRSTYDTPSGAAKSSDRKLEYQLEERVVVEDEVTMERA